MGFNVSRLFYSKPQSLGEGMKRVVCKAGGTKTAHLRKAANNYYSAAREYTNGVTIYHRHEGTSVLDPRGNLAATIASGLNELKGYWRKCSGWINGEQKHVVANIDINGNLVDKSTDKGKNVLRKYIGDIFGNTCEKMARDQGSYAKGKVSELLNKSARVG